MSCMATKAAMMAREPAGGPARPAARLGRAGPAESWRAPGNAIAALVIMCHEPDGQPPRPPPGPGRAARPGSRLRRRRRRGPSVCALNAYRFNEPVNPPILGTKSGASARVGSESE